MKRFIAVVLTFLLAANLCGCEALAKKFRRKKKPPVTRPRIYQVKDFKKQPAVGLYKKHYTYWASWQDEILQNLGENHKKDKLCIEQIVSNLYDMQSLLMPEKAEKLKIQIARLEKVKETVNKEALSVYNIDSIRMALERADRVIKRDFCYSKVKDYLIEQSGRTHVKDEKKR